MPAAMPTMQVRKRDGTLQDVHFDKITARIRALCFGLDDRFIDPVRAVDVLQHG